MISDEEILSVFNEADHPFLGTREVADALDYSLQGITPRLGDLVESGELKVRTIGGTRIYWIPEEG